MKSRRHTDLAPGNNESIRILCLRLAEEIAEKMKTFFKTDMRPMIFTQTTRLVGTSEEYFGIVVRFYEENDACNHSAALDWLYKELKKHPEIFFRVASHDDDRFLVRKDFPGIERLVLPKKKKKPPVKDGGSEST
ncbi:MAG: hypothetical protein WCI57_01570 [Candidatus Berkelbacteria bacterium]